MSNWSTVKIVFCDTNHKSHALYYIVSLTPNVSYSFSIIDIVTIGLTDYFQL